MVSGTYIPVLVLELSYFTISIHRSIQKTDHERHPESISGFFFLFFSMNQHFYVDSLSGYQMDLVS